MISLAFILLATLVTFGFTLYSFRFLKNAIRNFSLKPILLNFKPKIWMTFWLGVFFFGFYVLLITLSAYALTLETKLNIFFQAYQNPTKFIYIGLFVFAAVSVSIIWVRMVIKHLYNTKV